MVKVEVTGLGKIEISDLLELLKPRNFILLQESEYKNVDFKVE